MMPDREPQPELESATQATAKSLGSTLTPEELQKLSKLSLPEITEIVGLIARVVPAGNLPGMILNGFARLRTRKVPAEKVRSDVNALYRAVEQSFDRVIYGAFFAGPAAVIWAYQNILKLAGKKTEDAFPEGIWQFYVDYAMREDTARHANETHGFDSALAQEGLHLSASDRITAWVMSGIQTLHHYEDLLKNEWWERVATFILAEVTKGQPDAAYYAGLYRQWEKIRPYGLPKDGQEDDYPEYRRKQFEAFLQLALAQLSPEVRKNWEDKTRQSVNKEQSAYLKQMTIHAFLYPEAYSELRTAQRLRSLNVGIIYRGHYYLIRAIKGYSAQVPDLETVRSQVASILARPSSKSPVSLTRYIQIKRSVLPTLRDKLTPDLMREIDILKRCPILINCDMRPPQIPLSQIRGAERGTGDHAITIFDTGKTFVFDQSHIFFDGAWGAALAEIMTNEAIRWARQLHGIGAPMPAKQRPYRANLVFSKSDLEQIDLAPKVNTEVTAESDQINLRQLLNLRKTLKHRHEKLHLTVNDLLLLYRAIHAATYTPPPELFQALRNLDEDPRARSAGREALKAISRVALADPPIAIPIDASLRSPRDRLYPMTFTVPLADLNILELHSRCLNTWKEYQADRRLKKLYAEFEQAQVTYLAMLAGFGEVMNKAKEIANNNETVTAATAKLLAYVPSPLQRLMQQIPERFNVLNDIIKGREVFSNVGQVVASSTLVRFTSAKDDTDKKIMSWGVITDAQGTTRISLRDFRPHVGSLERAGRKDLALRIAEDYLEAYVRGFNQYLAELRQIVEARDAE